jgi:tetrahydromethanopterin S-methyltransferase subunit B
MNPVTEVPPVLVIENPTFLEPLPVAIEDEAAGQSIVESIPEEPISEPEALAEEDVYQSQDPTQPVFVEESLPGAEPPYLLFGLVGLLVFAGLVGVRFIGR